MTLLRVFHLGATTISALVAEKRDEKMTCFLSRAMNTFDELKKDHSRKAIASRKMIRL
jgi:hypothetical protein